MRFLFIKVFVICFISILSCGKSQEAELPIESKKISFDSKDIVSGVSSEETLSTAPSSTRGELDQSKIRLAEEKSQNNLGSLFLPNFATNERLLEYDIQLSYECQDLIQTRKDLIDAISKYGYLESSSAVNTDTPYMEAKIHINSSKLFEALLVLDKLGNLLTEDISTIDHTENQVWQKRKTTRESLRLRRKNLANSQISAAAKNWEAIDESLTQSEDQLDLAEHEIWKIQDRVKWAKVTLRFSTPMPKDKIQVPSYQNALVGILNAFLELTYYLLWIIPFGLFFALLGCGFYLIWKSLRKSLKR